MQEQGKRLILGVMLALGVYLVFTQFIGKKPPAADKGAGSGNISDFAEWCAICPVR